MSGADVVRESFPEAAKALGELQACRPAGVMDLLGDPAVLELLARFRADATRIDDDLRARFHAATGDRAEAVMQVVYAEDLVPRVLTMTDGFYGPGAWLTYPSHDVDDLGPALDRLLTAIDGIDVLEPATVEAITVRVAQLAGAPVPTTSWDPAVIERHYAGDLPTQLKAILAVVDTYIRTPFDRISAVQALVDLLDPPTTAAAILTAAGASAVRMQVALEG